MPTFKLILVVTAATFLLGCPPKQPEVAQTSGGLSAGALAGDDGSQTVGDSTITQWELDQLRANFGRVHFDFDSSVLEADSREILSNNADILVRHPDVRVRVEGHADHWGSDIYNLALGQRRADTVVMYLTDLGVTRGQLEVISYGEERPLVGDSDHAAEAPNRRAEFLVIVSGEGIVSSSY
jgi:peptidoglycan-associated lipoprotein